ncbi:MAG: hypothetical protein IPO91_09340 [Chloroflexi bacterium]|uniref:hypothetical protein n=2 Tax=Candidatus Flexifilum breve TaxID=3140694 RepID=UPI003134C20B|nr:hypothetical protein [Chloroflexota bacterium]MBK9746974.1 hypothetical protein [Chloroflexota bacterium]
MIMSALSTLVQAPLSIFFALALQVTAFRLLRKIGAQFRASTINEHDAFDFQNKLTAAEIYTQLPDYTAESKRLYTYFFIVDFFFPLFASLFLALVWTALLQAAEMPTLYGQLLAAQVPVFAFAPALFDWGENICFLLLVRRYPTHLPNLARAAVICKRLKLLTLGVTGVVSVVLVVATLILWVVARTQ